ncbi:response regulator receiver domain [Sphingobacterium sp. FBM7-1]|uniref:response regulator receiver domain n=1 Tax=Sphingobacterium sp. FBM7-1 TaxID=2886688 RepID=UPI001D11E190|nr:response regulator receiver domain [Sphingobacterium sp. FBM7-1]MCC2598262.1 hypothetical protein [Sphingobacterium sp. FBM7-1]
MYSQKAIDILNSSINSAVFIDEKAKDFFSETPINTQVVEEKLSVDLFKTFKKNGKSLVVHKFEKDDLTDTALINYLFSGKDLILLDWELDNDDGQQYSLELLSKSIEIPYINFCCIYSRSKNFDNIPIYLTAYFSGLQDEDAETIKDTYSYITIEDIESFYKNPSNSIDTFFDENQISVEDFPIERFRNKPKETILDLIRISLNKEVYFFQDGSVINHEVIYSGANSFIINNTFVLAIKKENDDSDYKHLIQRISNEIIKSNSSFFQLLGLEMQSIFNANERFIDETILKSSTEALFQFRNHIKDDKTFGIVIKKLLLEQATLKLRTAKLKLLDSEFLKNKSDEIKEVATKEDLFQLNVFYNSVTVKGITPEDIPNLNFGDVFKDVNDNYYLCITALCDCYYPNKIESNYYFAKGKEFPDLETALRLGDTAFLSFLPNNKVVHWGDTEIVKKDKIKKLDDESEEQFSCRKLEAELKAYKGFLYKPFYIKPKVYNVESNKLVDNTIRIWDITNKMSKTGAEQNLNYINVEYITTLRSDYAQRIANHAFGHPSRVGVDFVKII